MLYILLLVISSYMASPQSGERLGAPFISYAIFFTFWQYWLPLTIGAPLCYTVLFVILKEFETALATFLERRLRIPRNHQRRIKYWLSVVFGTTVFGLDMFLMVTFFRYFR